MRLYFITLATYFDAKEGVGNSSSSDARGGGMVILAGVAADLVATASVTAVDGQGSGANKADRKSVV